MKKALKMIGIILLIAVAAIVGILVVLSRRPAAPADYQTKVQTGGSLEAKYMADGPYRTESYEEKALQEFEKYQVFYPADLISTDRKWPVIVLCNGTGTPLSKYTAVAKHYASWGFIVIGTEERYSWNGFGAEMCLRYLERMNENQKVGDKDSLFYQKADFDHVGIAGHSQGGVGVISAVTATEHRDMYKAAAVLSPTNRELAHSLMWEYDAALVNVPVMLISGAGGGDDPVVTGEQLQEIYEEVPSDKVMLRRKDTAHGEVLYSEDGYVMAWFMWLLRDDEEAGRAFTGSEPEIVSNRQYQDQKISLTSSAGHLRSSAG